MYSRVLIALLLRVCRLMVRREWNGLQEFIQATATKTLTLSAPWVNETVLAELAKTCTDIQMVHVQHGTLFAEDLQTVAAGKGSDGNGAYGKMALIYHGDAPVDGGQAGTQAEMSVKELLVHKLHAETTFAIAGFSRFM